MRLRALALILLVPLASAGFGAGPTAFREYEVDGITSAPEPTIGIPWNTDDVFYHAGSTTMRGTFTGDEVAWEDVTPIYQVPQNLDPMLVADEDTGRILAGGLHGACSVMYYSDDNGETWLPSGNMCSGVQFDHQSIGIGPKPFFSNPDNIPQLQNAYYCGQLVLIGCSVSLDGGVTWTAPSPVVPGFANSGCGGFHGHWRISRVTGTAFLPVPACNGHGMIIPNLAGVSGTEAGGLTGLTWDARIVEGSHEWDGGFDPSIGISRDNGWLYYGMADHMGARIALSKDEGLTWEALPDGAGATTTWQDVGQFHDPPVVAATFADVQAGDDARAAFTFLGLLDTDGDGKGTEFPDLYGCAPPQDAEGNDLPENRYWHYFAAFTYDAGQNWSVSQLTDHPVQVGGIWDGGGGNPCRNLLDFNDMDIDSMGRVHIAWADGCLGDCLNATGSERYSRAPRLLRQVDGVGLFAGFDTVASGPDLDGDGVADELDDDIDGDGVPNDEDTDPRGTGTQSPDNDTSALGLGAVVVAVMISLRRRR